MWVNNLWNLQAFLKFYLLLADVWVLSLNPVILKQYFFSLLYRCNSYKCNWSILLGERPWCKQFGVNDGNIANEDYLLFKMFSLFFKFRSIDTTSSSSSEDFKSIAEKNKQLEVILIGPSVNKCLFRIATGRGEGVNFIFHGRWI